MYRCVANKQLINYITLALKLSSHFLLVIELLQNSSRFMDQLNICVYIVDS